MRLNNPFFQVDRAPESGQTDLISSVSMLAECLDGTVIQSGTQPGTIPVRDQAINIALNAAMDAERRIAEQMERIAYLERLAITDELTGLLNRRGFENQLRHTLAVARRYNEEGVLVYVDLDGFKPVNDTYGHAAGDEVLRRVGKALMENVRDTDYVGRMGGDEFAILLTRTTREDGLKRAEGLDSLLNRVFTRWRGQKITLRASVGFLPYTPEDDAYDLLTRADEAMYKTKRLRTQLEAERARA